jgi:hypothetical protein
MSDKDAETRGGEQPADWKGPGDVTPDPLPKGGEPAGAPLIDVLAPVETHHEEPRERP